MKQIEALEILKTRSNVFLTGEPGSGKTYTINMFRDWLENRGYNCAVTASTGIAAVQISGQTVHSFCGIGIQRVLSKTDLDKIKFNHWKSDKIKMVDTLIIDEISMLDATTINNVDRVFRYVRDSEQPFGGVQVVFVGDFFQLPPVVKRGEELKFAFEADAWKKANPIVCYLTEQHRQSDQQFLEILTSMRAGNITQAHKDILNACQMAKIPDTVLFTKNADVDYMNRTELEKLPGQMYEYKMETEGIDFLVEQLKKDCLSPETLQLKEGAVVMFTRNNPDEGYVNGSIGKVVFFTPSGMPVVELQNGNTVYADQMAEWQWIENKTVKARIHQIPLRLAWAITVHKSQGMSLDSASIHLGDTFEFGQGYVALSRVRTLEGLHLAGINDMAFKMHPRIVEQDIIFRNSSSYEDNSF